MPLGFGRPTSQPGKFRPGLGILGFEAQGFIQRLDGLIGLPHLDEQIRKPHMQIREAGVSLEIPAMQLGKVARLIQPTLNDELSSRARRKAFWASPK